MADTKLYKALLNERLVRAIKTNDLDTIKLVLGAGADVNFSPQNDNTPLHLAAVMGNINIVAYLIGRGANIMAENKRGLTPLMLADSFNNPAVYNHLYALEAIYNEEMTYDKEKMIL